MESELSAAVAHLKAGGLVVFPTETVYGLGADADNPLAVRRIFAAKGRPLSHPLIVHLAPSAEPREWAKWSTEAQVLADAFWPGPLTMVLNRAPGVCDEVTAGLNTVGLRVPAHPLAQALLTAFGGGLAAPSANRFGRLSPTTAAHVHGTFDESVQVLDGGPCSVGIESTIVDLSGPRPAILRPGGIPIEDIEALVGSLAHSNTPAPGALAKHYAPRTTLLLTEQPAKEAARLRSLGRQVEVLRMGEPVESARKLYAELRRLDGMGVDVLVAERAPKRGLGLAINDRLERAARGSGAKAD